MIKAFYILDEGKESEIEFAINFKNKRSLDIFEKEVNLKNVRLNNSVRKWKKKDQTKI